MGVPLIDCIKRLEKIAPLKLAESWDNVGLLVQPDIDKNIETVLLTIDLTEDVVQEAVENRAKLIISYHPNIFRPLKTVTQSHWKERIITSCIKNDIAVYSPHTSWDAMYNGVNDWLISALEVEWSRPILANADDPSIGMGRIGHLVSSKMLRECIKSVTAHIGIPAVRVGVGRNKELDSLVSTVAVCAGSGTSILKGVEADLYITGEMLHHDVLEATQTGINVILCNHSDSERGYLKQFQKLFEDENLNVLISKVDRDCLTTVIP